MTRFLNPDDKPACTDIDPELWFPEVSVEDGPGRIGGQNYQDVIEQGVVALKICMSCPLQEACLKYAFESSDSIDYGIYGGTLAYERRDKTSSSHSGKGIAYQRKIRILATLQGVARPIFPQDVRRPGLLRSDSKRDLRGA